MTTPTWSNVFLGMARLPKEVSPYSGALLIELAVDAAQERIVGVDTNISLLYYNALLRELLVGRRLDDVGSVSTELSQRSRGPLLRPTIAALAQAVSGRGSGT